MQNKQTTKGTRACKGNTRQNTQMSAIPDNKAQRTGNGTTSQRTGNGTTSQKTTKGTTSKQKTTNDTHKTSTKACCNRATKTGTTTNTKTGTGSGTGSKKTGTTKM